MLVQAGSPDYPNGNLKCRPGARDKYERKKRSFGDRNHFETDEFHAESLARTRAIATCMPISTPLI
jgi:hypothetical protein